MLQENFSAESHRDNATSLRTVFVAAAACAATFAAGPAYAATTAVEKFPSKPIRIVIGFTPGGVPDMTGRVQFFLSPLASAINLVKDGKALAIGVTSMKRVSQLPEIPTVAESGLPGYRWDFWYGMLAPAKTPRAIIVRLNGEITRILNLPDVRQRWSALGAEPAPSTPEAFDKLIAEEIVSNTRLARAANIKAD